MKISIGFLIIFIVDFGVAVVVDNYLIFAKSPKLSLGSKAAANYQQRLYTINHPEIIKKSFVVSVRHERTHICQGTIVASRLVIVPSHCVKCNSTGEFDLQVFGVKKVATEIYDKPINVSTVNCIKNYPYDNIALLWLNDHIDNEYYQFLNLPTTNDLGESKKHFNTKVVGWGLTKSNSKKPETIPEIIVPEQECLTVVGELNCQKFFCTPKKKYDICKNDNDAVLVYNNTLIGIATKKGCETNEKYNVFIRLSRYF